MFTEGEAHRPAWKLDIAECFISQFHPAEPPPLGDGIKALVILYGYHLIIVAIPMHRQLLHWEHFGFSVSLSRFGPGDRKGDLPFLYTDGRLRCPCGVVGLPEMTTIDSTGKYKVTMMGGVKENAT